MELDYGNAICYSGYREGQSPREQIYPSHKEIAEDLHLLAPFWKYLRLYDSGPHAEIVLEVIEREGLEFKVMLGADVGAEVNNPGCPWGAEYPEKQLASNILANDKQIDKMIELANRYPDIICCVSIGNEASVEWTDHMVPVQRLVAFTRRVKASVRQPVTFCENYVPLDG